MWRENFINANPATIMQRLYQLKAEQDGRDVVVIAHAERRADLPEAGAGLESSDGQGCPSVGAGAPEGTSLRVAGCAAFAPTQRADTKKEAFA